MLEAGLEGLDQRRGQQRKNGATDVLFVIESGNAPARESKKFMLPVPTPQGLILSLIHILPVGGDALRLISPVRTIVFGLLIVGFLIFEPHGLAEIWRRVRRYFHLWPFRT